MNLEHVQDVRYGSRNVGGWIGQFKHIGYFHFTSMRGDDVEILHYNRKTDNRMKFNCTMSEKTLVQSSNFALDNVEGVGFRA